MKTLFKHKTLFQYLIFCKFWQHLHPNSPLLLSALEDHKTGIASRKFIQIAWFQATPVNNFTKITFTPICWFIYFYLSFNYLCHHVSKVRLKYHNEESTTSHFRPAFIIKVLFFGTMSIVYLGIFQWEKEIKISSILKQCLVIFLTICFTCLLQEF